MIFLQTISISTLVTDAEFEATLNWQIQSTANLVAEIVNPKWSAKAVTDRQETTDGCRTEAAALC